MPHCPRCEDCYWVCEVHPDKPWDGPNKCGCGGAGDPCPDCNTGNPPKELAGMIVIARRPGNATKESPNKSNPQEDIVFIIAELLQLFDEADDGSLEPVMTLSSNLGSTFHARVLNAAKHLGMMPPKD